MSVRGNIKFAVLMCKLQDRASVEPFQAGYLEDLVVRRGMGRTNDYWRDASLGNVNLDGSRVFDWRVQEKFSAVSRQAVMVGLSLPTAGVYLFCLTARW